MIAYVLGHSSGRRAALRGRGRIGCGFVLAWLVIIGACIVWWRWFLVIGLPIILGLVAAGLVTGRYVNGRRRSGVP